MDTSLITEKVDQARNAVADHTADAWVIFCRETTEIREPCLPYVLGFDVVWPTAVVVGPDDSAVVLGRHDAPNAERLGVHAVYPYDASMQESLHEVLDGMAAETVAVNFDRDDNVADGLTHGLFLRLQDLLPGREFVGAGDIVKRVRGIKSETEQERITAAAETTTALLDEMAAAWSPETTEAEVRDWFHGEMRDRDLGSAWSWDYCPTVHAGGDSPVGHTLPGDRVVPDGELLHVDFGVVQDGYAADVQRIWVRGDADPDLEAAFRDVRAAIDAGHEVLEPGVVGHAVDTAAREELTSRGWPAFEHAFGHQVGRTAHDGGTLLGPEWDRYGESPRGAVRPGEVYTMELGVETEWGYVGQEEMVRITETGTEFVVPPQTDLWRLD
jgi:Xaa-Pro aminopeptidase